MEMKCSTPTEQYHSARMRYKRLIKDAFREVEYIFSLTEVGFSLTEIDQTALDAWRTQWDTNRWDWDYLCNTQLTAIAKRFTIAIWDGEHLAGLCYGKVSRGRQSISIGYLQSNSCYIGPLNRKIAIIATAVARALGKRVGASYVTMLNPVNTRVEQHYEKIGYSKLRAFGDRKAMHMRIF